MTRLYTLALRLLLPREVRDVHGGEMAAVYEAQLRDVRRRAGWRGVASLAARESGALLRFAWSLHRGTHVPARPDERALAWSTDERRRQPMWDLLVQDVRYGLRVMARAPGLATAAILTMAIAIGANAAVFALVYAVLLSPLPFPGADRLVVLGHQVAGDDGMSTTTPGNLADWRASAGGFAQMAGFAYTERIIQHGDQVDRTLGALSVGSVFDVLGREAAQGRVFTAADDAPGAPAVVVLSHTLNQRLFGAQDSTGRTLQIGGVPFTVIGVMPADFAFPDADALYWIPARFNTAFTGNRDQFFLLALARLAEGITLDQGRAQLDTVMDAIRQAHPQATQNATGQVVPLKAYLTGDVQVRLWILLGAVVLVLLIACANVANLLLARGTTRRREMAVRLAVGAQPQRLVAQMLTESVMLVAVGGASGIALGHVLLQLLLRWLPDDVPRAQAVSLDPTVLAVTAGATVLCGLLCGLWPALRLSVHQTAEAVRHAARETGRRDLVRGGLVVAETALAVVVLVGAGLLLRSFDNLRHVPTGFDPSGVLTFTVSLPSSTYATGGERAAFLDRLREALAALPGVAAVAQSTTLPVAGRGVGAWFNVIDRPLSPTETPPAVPYRVVTPEFFDTLGIPVVAGRALSEQDRPEGPRGVVVSQAVARHFWPDGTALGQRIYLGAPDNRIVDDVEIVGVVGDVKQAGLDEMASEAVYIPQRLAPPWSGGQTSMVVRTTVTPSSIAGAARGVVRGLDAAVPVYDVRTMEDIVARALAPARSSAWLLGSFALVALALAVMGVFGVLSYSVGLRRPEIAVRMALGASTGTIARLMFQQAMAQVGAGIVLGVLICVPLARSAEALLFDVAPADPMTLAAAALVLATVAAAAVALPCRRATRVDPMLVLRES
ncbi:MAG: ABC transporter permease [Vicinamibacterales bacterium]|nr:ABC transporter permease [Vicinamibacterales bacterium]